MYQSNRKPGKDRCVSDRMSTSHSFSLQSNPKFSLKFSLIGAHLVLHFFNQSMVYTCR